jgi:hypothetical protein
VSASIFNGWVTVPYSGHELAPVYIAIDDREDWKPAFLDWENGKRVAKVRPPSSTGKPMSVWIKANGYISSAGRIIH